MTKDQKKRLLAESPLHGRAALDEVAALTAEVERLKAEAEAHDARVRAEAFRDGLDYLIDHGTDSDSLVAFHFRGEIEAAERAKAEDAAKKENK